MAPTPFDLFLAQLPTDQLGLVEINHRFLQPGLLQVDDETIGRSGTFPVALRIVVAEDALGFPAGIGRLAHSALFAEYPRFIFKVVFACAHRNLLGHGDYANPNSIWYNVFFGYYEIDVPRHSWGRPFGYEDDQRTVRFEDIVRIGKADWNYFSNYLYGVPEEAIRPLDTIEMSQLATEQCGRQQVGGYWDRVRLANVVVVGPYVSEEDGQSLRDVPQHPVVSWAWRFAFGTYPHHDAGPKTSFAGTPMRAEFYLCNQEATVEGEEVYKTYIFGGTVNEAYPNPAENQRFLELQLAAVRRIMLLEEGLGFSSP
jgi:hypothetical protein